MNPVTTISVIGTGYLGTTHAACMADLGFGVVGVDVDPAKVAALAAGEPPFYEPDLKPMVAKHVEHGRLRFTAARAGPPRARCGRTGSFSASRTARGGPRRSPSCARSIGRCSPPALRR